MNHENPGHIAAVHRQLTGRHERVGNSQRTLFALFSLISCGIFIGYFLSFDRIHSSESERGAFFWRSIIWQARTNVALTVHQG